MASTLTLIERELIDMASLDPRSSTCDMALETECANATIDGCAEELAGVDLSNVTPECKERILRVVAAIKGTVLGD